MESFPPDNETTTLDICRASFLDAGFYRVVGSDIRYMFLPFASKFFSLLTLLAFFSKSCAFYSSRTMLACPCRSFPSLIEGREGGDYNSECNRCLYFLSQSASNTWFVLPVFSSVTIPRSANRATILCVCNLLKPVSFRIYFCKYFPSCALRTSMILRSSSESVLTLDSRGVQAGFCSCSILAYLRGTGSQIMGAVPVFISGSAT